MGERREPTLQPNNSSMKPFWLAYVYMLLWIGLSGAVIMLNKYIFAYTSMKYPVFLTLCHMVFCSALATVLLRLRVTEPIHMDWTMYTQCVLPIGGLFAGTLWMGNAAYLYLSVAFIQMIKAMMPLCVFSVGCLLGTERYSHAYLANMTLVAVGVAVASYGELNFHMLGAVLQCSSLVTESFRLVLIQILLQSKGVKMNPIHSLYYIAPACCAFLVFPFTFFELPRMLRDEALVILPGLLLVSAAAAFALNLSVFLLIGQTSALTMNVAGVIKDWMLIGLSVLIYQSPVSLLQYCGYGLAFLGATWYNYVKVQAAASAGPQSDAAGKAAEENPKDAGDEKLPLLQQELSLPRQGDFRIGTRASG